MKIEEIKQLLIEDLIKTKIIKGSRFNFLQLKFLRFLMIVPKLDKKIQNYLIKNKIKNIKIKNRLGVFEISSHDDAVLITSPYFEYRTQKWIENSISKNIFLDIGANIGVFSILANKSKFKKIYSYESNPNTFLKLKKTIKYNNIKNIHPINIGIGEKKCKIDFLEERINKGSSHFLISSKNKDSKKLNVDSLDNLIKKEKIQIKDISFIKIDVEGFEFFVIKGMLKILENLKKKSKIYIEIWDRNKNKNKIEKLLEKNNFKLIDKSKENYLYEKK